MRETTRGERSGPLGDVVFVLAGLLALVLLSPENAGAEERVSAVSFRNDVMAVLSKAGCNAGVCHGNRSGKGGFKLSLRGQDPGADYRTLTRASKSRRIDRIDPDASLILLKPTTSIAHEGGLRFSRTSWQYETLRSWIAAGAPEDPDGLPVLTELEAEPRERVVVLPERTVALRATARFSDGSLRDVTERVVYESSNQQVAVDPGGVASLEAAGGSRERVVETTIIVRYLHLQTPVRLTFVPERPDFVWADPPAANFVDERVFRKLRSLRMNPSGLATDEVYLRRVYLDLCGILPTSEEARAFVTDSRPDKRSRLVDSLLDRPEFADHWALKWSDLLRNEEKALDRKGVQNFHHWIRRSIERGKPLDRFARELIASRGSTYVHPEANYYRAMRDPLTRAESTAQVFLGTRLQCARCHNHPFDRWTQDDYYGWAGLFARIRYKIVENRRRDRNDKHEFVGEQIVWIDRRGEVEDPRTGRPATPKFLGSETAVPPGEDRLEALADWVARDEPRRRFAKAQANRIWYHLLGRGIVEPIDDFRATNPPSHPELLEDLARELIENGFDLRETIRTITSSRTYQLSSVPNATNRDDERNFSHALVRRLSAEQLLDSLSQVAGVPVAFNGYPEGLRAAQIPGVKAVRPRDRRPSSGDAFLEVFGKPPRLLTCECERSSETNLGQAFELISGEVMNELLTEEENRLGRLLDSGKPDREIIDEIYWSTLARAPASAELETAVRYLEEAADRRSALEDIAWGIVNSKEFLLRR